MAVTVDAFDIDRALNGEPVGLPTTIPGGYDEDEFAQLTGFVSKAPGGNFKTFIDGVELTLNDTGTVIGCTPDDSRFFNSQTSQGVTLMMINETLGQTFGTSQNITRNADSGNSTDVYMSSLQPRDEFAMRAFSVLIQNVENPEAVSDAKMLYISRAAYRWANAMMRAGANARVGTPPATQGEVTVSQGELQSTTDKLLYNLVHILKQQDQDGITIKEIKKLTEVTEIKKLTELQKLTEVSLIKKLSELTELKTLTELTEIKKLAELTELKKLTELTEIKDIDTIAELTLIAGITDLTGISSDLGNIDTSLGTINTTLGTIESDLSGIDNSIDDVADAINQNP